MNEAQKETMKAVNKHWFFAVEHTAETSLKDIEDFCVFIDSVCERFNMKWCQTVWKDDLMKRVKQ